MGLFDLFKKKKVELTEEQLKWNKMWELWEKGEADSPYGELMTYQSEINNGGHGQYFFNVENTGDLNKEISALETVLSDELAGNLQNAYKAHVILEENEDDEKAEMIIEKCDEIFFENEEEINSILEVYANEIQL
ncbi:MAG: DUF4375 domain-containing protein [Clostridia bacterium]|nr:DUF4375 domain-containing protein [Clostridia bacterium]